MQDRSWKASALCDGLDTLLFFPDDESLTGQASIHARSYCFRCPVQIECLQFAVLNRHTDGIFGGLGGEEREHLAKVYREEPSKLWDRCRAATDRTAAVLAGDEPERPWKGERECDRCGARVKPGAWPEDKNGPNASCGKAATYNKGCRCDWCVAAKSILHEDSKESDSARAQFD